MGTSDVGSFQKRRILRIAAIVAAIFALGISTRVHADPPATIVTQSGPRITYESSKALLIGNSRYDPISWGALDRVPVDIENVTQALKQQGYNVIHQKQDLARGPLASTIKDFLLNAEGTKADRLFLFYSGHGWTDYRTTGYLVPIGALAPVSDSTNAHPNQIGGSMLDMHLIREWADQSKARHVVAIFDSCFSGSIFMSKTNIPPRDVYVDASLATARQFITAGSATQQVPGDGVFADALVKGIRGTADYNGDSLVTADELGVWLKTELASKNMTPQRGSLLNRDGLQGDVIVSQAQVATRPRAPFPGVASLYGGVDIVYYSKSADGEVLQTALDRNGVPFRSTKSSLPDTFRSNAIGCGPDTPVAVLKNVAQSMVRAGFPIKVIRQFQNPASKPKRLEITSVSQDAAGKLPRSTRDLSFEQIDNLRGCPQTQLSN